LGDGIVSILDLQGPSSLMIALSVVETFHGIAVF